MNLTRNASRIVWADVRKVFASRRGRILMAVLLLLGSLPGGIRIWSETLGTAAVRARLVRGDTALMVRLYGRDAAIALAGYPSPAVWLTLFTLTALPLLLLVAGYDRARQPIEPLSAPGGHVPIIGVVALRFVSLWLSVILMVLIAHVALWVCLWTFGHVPARVVFLIAGPRLFLACALSALPYAGLTIAAGVLSGSSGRVLLFGTATLLVLWLGRGANVLGPTVTRVLFPAANDGALLAGGLTGVGPAAALGALWSAAALAMAALVLAKRRAEP